MNDPVSVIIDLMNETFEETKARREEAKKRRENPCKYDCMKCADLPDTFKEQA